MPKRKVIYQESTNTVRLMPENYMLFVQVNGRWYYDPDKAISMQDRILMFSTFQQCSAYMNGADLAKIIELVAPE